MKIGYSNKKLALLKTNQSLINLNSLNENNYIVPIKKNSKLVLNSNTYKRRYKNCNNIQNKNIRYVKFFKNIIDSNSDDLDDIDISDNIMKWYSINPYSYVYDITWKFIYMNLLIMLIYFPFELWLFSIDTLKYKYIHMYFETILLINFLLKTITGLKDNKLNKINYNIVYIIKNNYINNMNYMSLLFDLTLLFYNSFFIIKVYKYITHIPYDTLMNINIISKIFIIFYFSNWININSIIDFSNKSYMLTMYFNTNLLSKNSFNILSYIRRELRLFFLKHIEFFINFFISLRILMFYLIYIHYFSCIWIFIYRYEDRNTYKPYSKLNDFNSMYNEYVTAVYFMCTTLFSIGYGDIYPITHIERIYIILFMILCAFFYSFLITLISFMFSRHSRKTLEKEAKFSTLKSIKKDYKISNDLYKKLYKHIVYNSNKDLSDKIIFVNELPQNYMRLIQESLFFNIIKRFDFLKMNQNKNYIYDICNNLKSQFYDRKIIIIKAGFMIEEIIFISKGSLLIRLDSSYDDYILSKMTKNYVFGDHLIDINKVSPYILETYERNNEFYSLSKEKYIKIKEKYPIEVENSKKTTIFLHNFIEELCFGAKKYYEVYGSLVNFRNMIRKLVNNQINMEIDNKLKGKEKRYLFDMKDNKKETNISSLGKSLKSKTSNYITELNEKKLEDKLKAKSIKTILKKENKKKNISRLYVKDKYLCIKDNHLYRFTNEYSNKKQLGTIINSLITKKKIQFKLSTYKKYIEDMNYSVNIYNNIYKDEDCDIKENFDMNFQYSYNKNNTISEKETKKKGTIKKERRGFNFNLIKLIQNQVNLNKNDDKLIDLKKSKVEFEKDKDKDKEDKEKSISNKNNILQTAIYIDKSYKKQSFTQNLKNKSAKTVFFNKEDRKKESIKDNDYRRKILSNKLLKVIYKDLNINNEEKNFRKDKFSKRNSPFIFNFKNDLIENMTIKELTKKKIFEILNEIKVN